MKLAFQEILDSFSEYAKQKIMANEIFLQLKKNILSDEAFTQLLHSLKKKYIFFYRMSYTKNS
jgi:hypothetical protein